MRRLWLRQHARVKNSSLWSFVVLGVAAALPAQDPDPVLARLPANASNVLVVRDLLPPVEALLRTPQVVELLAATTELQERTFGTSFSAQGLRKQLQLVRDFVPVRAGLGVDAGSIDGMVELGRAALFATVLLAAGEKVEEARPALASMREQCQEALTKLRSPNGLVFAELRDERVAEAWFGRAVKLAASMGTDPAVDVVEADASLTVSFDMFALGNGRLRKQLAASGVELPPERTLPIVLRLEQRGAELVLRVGEPATGPLVASSLGQHWSTDPAQVLFSRIDLSALATAAADAEERVTAIAEHVSALQSHARMVQAFQLQSEEMATPVTGAVRIADGVAFVSDSDLGADAQHLEAPPARLLRCVRPDEGPFQVSSLPLPILASATLAEAKQRLARKGGSAALVDALFAGFDDAAALDVFGWGTVVVSRKAAFRSAPGWQGGPMPFASVAVLGVLEEGEDGEAFLRELLLRCGDAVDSDGPVCRQQDVGLGVPTQVLRLELLPAPFGAGVDADWSPHWFVVDGILVISSDVAWSKELIARLRGDGAVQLPAGRVVDWSMWQSDHLAATCEGLTKWFSVMAAAKPFVEDFMAIAAAAIRAVDRFEWISELDGALLRTRLELRLAKTPANPR